MVEGKDFKSVVEDAIDCIESYNHYYSDDEVSILNFISPFGKKGKPVDYRKLYRMTREELRQTLPPTFFTALEKLSEDGPITISDSELWFRKSFGGNIEGQALADDHKYYYSPDDLIGAREALDRLYWELKDQSFTLTPLDGPDGDAVTFSDEVDEAIEMVDGIIKDTFVDDLAKISTFRGRTVQSHLMAEDWGADKDAIFSTLCMKDTSHDREKSARSMIQTWIDLDRDDFSVKHYLKWMKPGKGSYGESLGYWITEWQPRLPKYWKASFVTLVKKLECGSWYDARELWAAFSTRTAQLHFTGLGRMWKDHFVKFAGDPPVFLVDAEGDRRGPLVHFKKLLVDRAVFFGMLYTLAIFGVLDITEKEPELVLMRTKTKKGPFSPFDCISRIRLTEYGRWVLGLREDKPEIQTTFSEPVLDKGLMLITYKGRSVTIRSFLGEIATPLGDIRWKVTQESFLSGCEFIQQAENRIRTMRKLFSPIPENWERFFDRVIDSYGITPAVASGQLLTIKDKKLVQQLLGEDSIRRHVLLVEGDRLFLFDSGLKAFMSALAKRGYNSPLTDVEEIQEEWKENRGK